jgi:hypothetical protein
MAAWLLGGLLVLAGAALASSGNAQVTVIVVAAVIGIFPLLNPAYALWFILTGGLVVAGLCQLYLPQIQEFRWSVALLSAVLGCIAIFNYLYSGSRRRSQPLPAIFWLAVAFIVLAIVSSLVVNQEPLNNFIFGFKGYFQVWGLLFAFLLIDWSEGTLRQIPKLLIIVAFLQFPFALHQYLYYVPQRIGLGEGIVAEDVVSGTFGASATGGGATAVVSIILMIVLAILISAYKKKLFSGAWLLFAAVVLLTPIALNSNKAVLVFIPIMYLMLFGHELIRRPGKSIAIGLFSVLAVIAVLWSYSTLLSRANTENSWEEFIAKAVEQNVSEESGHGEAVLNRWTVLTFWAQENRGNLIDVLLGHGVGMAREGEGGAVNVNTLAARKYPNFGIGLTGISAVLWELGVAGLALLFAMGWTTYRAAGRVYRHYAVDTWNSAIFEGLRFGVVLFVISWFFQPMLVFHLAYQTLLLTVFGYIACCQLRVRLESAERRNQAARAFSRQSPNFLSR